MDFERLIYLMHNDPTWKLKPDIKIPAMEERIRKLQKPTKAVDVVIDTDACNEADDQFAIAYALRSPECMNVQAFYAAPCVNFTAKDPQEGMNRSFDEIGHVLSLMGERGYDGKVFHGSERYLSDETTPVESEAVEDLIARGMARDPADPLYVIAIGAITNVASALIREPQLADHLVVLWHGGAALGWPNAESYNAMQDIAATRVVMGSGVPFIMQPGAGVAYQLVTFEQELRYWLSGKNALCDYLIQRVCDVTSQWRRTPVWSHPIVDVAAIAWFKPDQPYAYMEDYLCDTPLISYDGHYEFDIRRWPMRYVYKMNRDVIFNDLFERISK